MKKNIGLSFAFGLLVGQLQAATFVVNITADSGLGSLRQAILDANSTSGDNAIQFSVNGTITLSSALPTIMNNTTITGPGTNLLTISGDNQVRVFSMDSGTTNTLSGLTIADGAANGSGPFGTPFAYASGISNAGSLRITNCIIRSCTNFLSFGAGIYNAGSLEMEACVIADCALQRFAPPELRGAGVFTSGTLRMTDCLISGCLAGRNGPSGGGIYNTNSGSVFLTNTVIESCSSEGHIQGDGGGIANLGQTTLDTCTVSNCAGYWGGGLNSQGSLTMINTTVVRNRASGLGGGLFFTRQGMGSGCTISSNTCNDQGGGIQSLGSLTLYNCTISGNAVRPGSPGTGAGLADKYGISTGTNYLDHCTIVSNTGANGEVLAQGAFTTENSILADCKGTLISGGYNLLEDLAGCVLVGDITGNIYGVNPLLGPLQDNGGPTWTHVPLPGSPMIDRGSAGGLYTDQRGLLRPCDVVTIANAVDGSDIGAVEARPASVIEGRVSGFALAGEVGVNVGPDTITTVAGGRYCFGGFAPGDYTVRPLDSNYVFGPNTRLVTVGPDQLDIDFRAFRWNSLSVEGSSNRVFHLVFAGTNGQTHVVMASANATTWSDLRTNTLGASNYFEIFDPTSGTEMKLYRTRRVQ